ncbi:PP2C family protein-serine/threonine phosphatase [Mycobacterium sp. LTG2003]
MTGPDLADITAPGNQACPRCAATVRHADQFCESCGALLLDVRRVAIPRRAADLHAASRVEAGDRHGESDRAVAELGGVALVTDRGLQHAHNEDAAAAGIMTGHGFDRPYAIAVAVCDGVSTSRDAQTAAVAASMAGVDAMLTALSAADQPRDTVLSGLAAAAKAAVRVGQSGHAGPSCTYTGAVAVRSAAGDVVIAVGNIGDGRAYWLPEPPAQAQLLTVDDSVAQELLSVGTPQDSEEVRRGAHTLTRWLGEGAEAEPWSDSDVRTFTPACAGALLICTDGFWNYLPRADDIAGMCTDLDTTRVAHRLIDHAMRAGGEDNITVVVIPIGERSWARMKR